jgi:hypothetical protein
MFTRLEFTRVIVSVISPRYRMKPSGFYGKKGGPLYRKPPKT